jgi:hypothetical protein
MVHFQLATGRYIQEDRIRHSYRCNKFGSYARLWTCVFVECIAYVVIVGIFTRQWVNCSDALCVRVTSIRVESTLIIELHNRHYDIALTCAVSVTQLR